MTEKRVQVKAIRHQSFGFAKTIGISITSGGIGKNELSEKATTAKYLLACLCLAALKRFLYSFRTSRLG